jgi:copper transport protein
LTRFGELAWRMSASALVALAAVLALPASQSAAHSAFVGSSPGPGARLADSPREVRLGFTEPLNRGLSRATLVALKGGRRVTVSVSARGARGLILAPAGPLPEGAYRVDWHTVSTLDGHALEGSFSFGVRAAAASGGHAVEQSPLARNGWLRVVARIALYAGLLVFAGALLLRGLLDRGSDPDWLLPSALRRLLGPAETERVRRRQAALTGEVGLFTLAAAALAAVADGIDAAGGLSADGVADYLTGGLPGLARVAVVVCLVLAGLMASRGLRPAAVPALLALGAVAASGHASSASPRVLSIVNDWLHLTAVSVWAGGIALIVLTWASASTGTAWPVRQALIRSVLPRFGRVAVWAFAAVVFTGAVSALLQLGELPALWETAYGRVLALKIALVGLMATASYLHARRLRPRLLAANPHGPVKLERRHWQLLRAEPLLGLGAVAAVGFLVAFPLPPRQLGEADEAQASAPPCNPCPLKLPAPDELSVAEQAGSQLVAAWMRRRGGQLTGTVRVLDYRGRGATMPFRILGARQSACGRGCRRFRSPAGASALAVSVRQGGRTYVARLPARWEQGASARARRMLERAQAVMRQLRSAREDESLTSGRGSFVTVRYALRAPNRFTYATSGGATSIVVGRRQWTRTRDTSWRPGSFGAGIAFSTRSWFTWTNYARAVRLLAISGAGDRKVAEVALMDPGTPVWMRLRIELRTMRVLSQRMIAKAHYMTQRYYAFNRPVSIRPPRGPGGT